MWVKTIKWQTRGTHGCLVAGQRLWVRAWTAAYRLYVRPLCDSKAPLQLRLVVLHKCYMPFPLLKTVIP